MRTVLPIRRRFLRLVGLHRIVLLCSLLATAGGIQAATTEPDIRPWATLSTALNQDGWIVVMFWSVSCAICAAETPALSVFHRDRREPGVSLLGVSIDGAARRPEVARWMKRHEMDFPSLLGGVPEIAAYYRSMTEEQFLGTPTFMIFDPAGQLVGLNPGRMRIEALQKFITRKERTR